MDFQPTVPVLNILFVVVPILVCIYSIFIYVRNSRRHEVQRKNAILFKEKHQEMIVVEIHQEDVIEDHLHDHSESTPSEGNLLHEHEEVHKREAREFLDSIPFITKDLKDNVLKSLHPQEEILWADTPYYQVQNNGKLKSLLVTTFIVFVINFLFVFVSGFLVLADNALAVSFIGVLCSVIPMYIVIHSLVSLNHVNICYVITDKRIFTIRKKGYWRNDVVETQHSFENIHGLKHRNVGSYGNLYFCVKKTCQAHEKTIGHWRDDDTIIHNHLCLRGIYNPEKVISLLETYLTEFWKNNEIHQ